MEIKYDCTYYSGLHGVMFLFESLWRTFQSELFVVEINDIPLQIWTLRWREEDVGLCAVEYFATGFLKILLYLIIKGSVEWYI